MLNDRIFRRAFIVSSIGHFLCIALIGTSINFLPKQSPRNIKDIVVDIIEIERPALLPEIDIMGEKKKLPETAPESEEIVIEEPLEAEPEGVATEETARKPVEENEAMLRYQDMVKQRIESARRYPVWAKRQGIEGVVHLDFTVLSNGRSRDIKIVRSSGFNILDEEALDNIRRANPFPPIPEEIKGPLIQMDVSIVYTLK